MRDFKHMAATVDEPRAALLRAVLKFVCAARNSPGVSRIALLGSLATQKLRPKDADLLVAIPNDVELRQLARDGRRLKGTMQSLNLGADIFLVDEFDEYIGRICAYRECWPRAACEALHCSRRQHLNDDLQVITLVPDLVRSPPVELWPRVIRRAAVPSDVETILLAKLDSPRPDR